MTIAAGFNFDGGLLVCADSKHIGGMTLYETKISAKAHTSGAKSVFAIAGATRFARMALSECERVLSALSKPTKPEMEDAIKDTLVEIHRKHIFPHPDRGIQGGPDFNLMIGLWSPVDGIGLYSTDVTALDPVKTYDCLGSGDYLGHYIIRPRFRDGMTLKRVIFLATTALQRIKAYDPNCGGQSEIAVLMNTGELTDVEQFDISQGEAFSLAFYLVADAVYTAMAESESLEDEVELEQMARMLVNSARQARQAQQKEKALKDALLAALSVADKTK